MERESRINQNTSNCQNFMEETKYLNNKLSSLENGFQNYNTMMQEMQKKIFRSSFEPRQSHKDPDLEEAKQSS